MTNKKSEIQDTVDHNGAESLNSITRVISNANLLINITEEKY